MEFADRIAVVTGGASGIGRALVRRLAQQGCHVATCDMGEGGLAETRRLALEAAPPGVEVTTFLADVSDEDRVLAFRDHVTSEHGVEAVHLVFNNAGIAGGGSFVAGPRRYC